MKEKLKSFLADDGLYLALLIIGVGVLSFALGRLSVVVEKPQDGSAVNRLSLCPTTLCVTPVSTLAKPSSTETVKGETITSTAETTTKDQYVASKAGTKYHHLTCPGAKQIKDENKIYFQTAEEAQAAGYTRAANCKE